MSGKAANVQRKTLKDLQEAWRTVARDYFIRLKRSGSLEAKYRDKGRLKTFVQYCI